MKIWRISKTVGFFQHDRRAVLGLIALAALIAGWSWLKQHPQHNPFAPLDLRDPPGWATNSKLDGLMGNQSKCHAVMQRSEVPFTALAPEGDGPCGLPDRTQIDIAAIVPAAPVATCPVGAGVAIWLNNGLQQAAQLHLDTSVQSVVHLGTINCRRLNSSQTAPWSEHATGNAIDISGFMMANGDYVSVLQHWEQGEKGAFLKAARDAACGSFTTVLSPDYNDEHADHLHLDQGTRWSQVCR